jgi:hypothetical protein
LSFGATSGHPFTTSRIGYLADNVSADFEISFTTTGINCSTDITASGVSFTVDRTLANIS